MITHPSRHRLLGASLLLALALLRGAAPAGAAPRGPVRNVQASPSADFSQPAQLARNPTNPRNLLIGANDDGCHELGVYVSADGGQSWTDECPTVGLLEGGNGASVAFDAQGTAYLATVTCCGGPPARTIVLSTATDGGYTWAPFRTIYQNANWTGAGVGALAADLAPQSPHRGTLYLLVYWAEQVGSIDDSGLLALVSRDQGQTWQAAPIVQAAAPDYVSYASLAVAADGTVYVAWYRCEMSLTCSVQPREQLSISHDGGQTWSVPTTIAPVVPFPDPNFGECPFAVFGVLPNTGTNCSATAAAPELAVDSSGGPHSGRLYAVFQQWTGTHGIIVSTHSDDQGQHWSRQVVVENDHTGHDHFAPSVTVDSQGDEVVSWLDRRDDPANVQYRAYGALSTDGGQSFTNEPLATAPSTPGLSSYIGGPLLVAAAGTAAATWMDDRTGTNETEVGITPVR
jgi:hypothetical protein